MGILEDEHWVKIAGSDVTVRATAGLVEPTWKLVIDGSEADRVKGSGRLRLHGCLPDGSDVEARVHQGAFGPTEVVVAHEDSDVVRFTGFVI